MLSNRKRRAAVLLGMLTVVCPAAFGLNPTREISQYGHTAWTVRDGVIKGSVYALAQGADGYLILGTEFGLARFDGVRIQSWSPPGNQHLPGNNIRSLLTAHDATLWIGTTEGLASWKNGKLTLYPEVAGQNVFTLVEDRDGTIWAGTFGVPTARLCGIRGGTAHCYGEDGTFGQWVETLYQDSAGRLWAGAGTGLWRWKPDPPKRYSPPYLFESDQAILEDADRSSLIVICNGLWRMTRDKSEPYRLPGVPWPFTPLNMLRDRDGGLWVGTLERGLLHSYGGRTDFFSQQDGLSGNHVRRLFEDREGNIWVGTRDGLDRFRAVAATSFSVRQGMSSPSTMTALAARDGSVWAGSDDGLNRWKNGEITIFRASARSPIRDFEPAHRNVREVVDRGLADQQVGSLYEDGRGRIWVSALHGISRFENGRFIRLRAPPGGWVNGIIGDGGAGVWIAYQDLGLYHILDDRVVERFPWSALGHGVASAMLPDPRTNGLWLGFFDGGVVDFQGGQVRASFGRREGLGGGRVMGLQLDSGGALWASTEGGLSRIQEGRILTLGSANGLPCDGVHWTVADDARNLWLYTPCGLVRLAHEELDTWISHPTRAVEAKVFDASDGIRMKALLTGYTPRVSRAADGKIWFAHLDSISVVDPRDLPLDDLRPPVHIEQLTADRKVWWPNPAEGAGKFLPPLPPLTRDLEIDYTALCLVAADKVRFRYKLEGYDEDWQAAGNRRQALYASLPPRSYRFRVIASNGNGLWNETGDTLEFSVAPAYYQTSVFRAAAVAGILILIWWLFRLRIRRIAGEFQANLEGRVDERLRVARELHDTLLQSFQGLMYSFQAARNLLPGRTDAAIRTLEDAIRKGEAALAEGRDAIQNLRGGPALESNLEHLLTSAGAELAASYGTKGEAPVFHVTVEGARQALSPLVQDEIFRTAREVLRNAFHHAAATRIEAELAYDRQFFRLRIRDNGKGIERDIIKAGARPGHWGLSGVRERAKAIGAELKLWSEAGAGTEVELTLPARIAYGTGRRHQKLLSGKAKV